MSKDKEPYIFEEFKNLYNLPDCDVIYDDGPDYRIQIPAKIIGIEITEAVISEKDLRVFRFKVALTNDVLKILRDRLPFTFSIDIDTKENCYLSPIKRQKAIKELVEICSDECVNLKNLDSYKVYDFGAPLKDYPFAIQSDLLAKGYRNLPEGISEISLCRFDNIGTSWNTESTAIMVPNFTIEKLQTILKKKHKALKKYIKCDEQWLVIFGDRLPESYYNEVDINEAVNSDFDKIFFIQPKKGLIEIKVNHY